VEVATAFCPDPFIELQLARELNHGPLLSWAEEPLLAPPRVYAAIRFAAFFLGCFVLAGVGFLTVFLQGRDNGSNISLDRN
jgi:hypothetical protein